MNIFIWRNDAEYGPFSTEEALDHLLRGELSNDDFARIETDEQWRTLGELLLAKGESNLPTELLETPLGSGDISETPVEESVEFAPEPFAEGEPEILRQRFPKRKVFAIATSGAAMLASIVSYALFHPRTVSVSSIHPAQPNLLVAQPSPGEAAAPMSRVSAIPAPPPVNSAVVVHPVVVNPGAAPAVAIPNKPPRTAALPPSPPAPAPAETPPLSNPAPVAVSTPAPSAPAEAASTPAPAPIREIALPPTAEIRYARLWVAAVVPQPRAVLVFCQDPWTHPWDELRDPVWQQFARENHLDLAAAGFDSKPALRRAGGGFYAAEHESGPMLLGALDSAFGSAAGSGLPLILYGCAGGGPFAARVAGWKPERVLTWCAYSNDWFFPPAAERLPVPAIIACDRGALQNGAPAEKFFLAGRAEGKPWTLLSLAGHPDRCRQSMDEFFRQYVPAVLATQLPVADAGVWADPFSGRVLSSLDLMTEPARAAWLPNAELQQRWADLLQATQSVTAPVIVERDEPTRNPAQPSMHLYLRLPPGATDARHVSGVLAYCTWQKEGAALISGLSVDSQSHNFAAPFIKFAEDHNLAVLTWGTVDSWDQSRNAEEVDRWRQEQFDKNFELLADAWARGVAEFGRDAGLPQRDFLLYGISKGAQWAHRLAIHRPDYFLAVHVHIPSTFDKPTPEAGGMLWLVTTGEREYGYPRAQRFYHECCALGYPIIFKAIIGIGHSDSPIEHQLGLKFFEYALSMKAARDSWDRLENDPLAKLSASRTSGAGPWLETFRNPAYYGDFLNQECYPAQQAGMIPAALRVPLPTKELADLWNQ
jgi:hypothetical protein